MLKERLHLAESGKDEEVAKKVKMDNLIKIFEDILFFREKSKGTYSSRRERTMKLWSITTGKYNNNKIGYNRFLRPAKQGSLGSSRGQCCSSSPVGQSVCDAVQDEQVRWLCLWHWRGPEAWLPIEPSLQGSKVRKSSLYSKCDFMQVLERKAKALQQLGQKSKDEVDQLTQLLQKVTF